MSKAEEYIKAYTRGCSNELVGVEDKYGKKVISYHEWLTPENALAAVELAREEMMLTYKDIQRILDAADKLAVDYGSEKLNEIGYEDYCKEVLERYMETIKE